MCFELGQSKNEAVLIYTGSGELSDDEPLYFAGNTVHLEAKSDTAKRFLSSASEGEWGMAVVLTRKGIDLYRENKQVGHTTLMLDNDQSLGFVNLTGSKVQPVVFSADLSTIFIGGNSFVYAIDSMTFKLIDTLNIPLGRNISSMAVAGNLLLIGEGQRYGAVGSRLLAMNIRPGDKDYGNVASIDSADITGAPNGISGMTVGPDGKTLVVATPLHNPMYQKADRTKRGNVLVFDLSTIKFTGDSFKDGITLAAAIKAELPEDGFSGKAPETITATKDADRYLVADIADYDRGLATLVITRDDTGKITGAKMASIRMNQDSDKIFIDRLDIQRAQSAVLVKYQDIEYAIVSDDNRHSLDPYWQAMYEAPIFLFTPSGPPIAVGGSADARKVAVGGKLGIVKDPFGAAQYLGATLPLDGYGIVNLSLSEDGKVLLGQLAGLFSSNIMSSDNQLKPSKSGVWNVDTLIQAALDLPEKDRMTKHIKMPANSEQLLKDDTGWVAGTYFDPSDVKVDITGKMGDIIEVDLKRQVAHAILGLPAPGDNLSAIEKSAIDNAKAEIKEVMDNLCNFYLVAGEKESLIADTTKETRSMTLVTKDDTDKTIITDGSESFYQSGKMYLAPNITQKDEDKLREGGVISDKQKIILLTYNLKKDLFGGMLERFKAGSAFIDLTVTAKDYSTSSNGATVFFGDRPLDNPGYSAFTLKSEVKMGSKDTLDVWRVEQRLKYLAFPAMGTGSPTAENNTIQNFDVDGKFDVKETAALKLFEKVVRYGPGLANRQFELTSPGADGMIEAGKTNAQGILTTGWLNAYNAPHWMQFFASTGNATSIFKSSNDNLKGWKNTQIGTYNIETQRIQNVEVYGTSWMYDLMTAKGSAQKSLFNGSVDANYGVTPQGVAVNGIHKTHDLGMAFDLGVSNNIDRLEAQLNYLEKLTLDTTHLKNTLVDPLNVYKGTLYSNIPDKQAYDAGEWTIANANYLSGLLVNSTDPLNNQRAALRDFLTLYALTRSDTIKGNGTWDDLPVVNGEKAREALFGSGFVDGGLISEVHIGGDNAAGQNPYLNINDILDSLGIYSTPVKGHQNHFHIYLNPPEALAIDTTQHLLADALTGSLADTATTVVTLQTEAQGLVDYAHTLTNIGEEIMFTIDVPYVPVQNAPIMLAQAATSGAGTGTQQPDYLLQACKEMLNDGEPLTAENGINPAGWLVRQLEKQSNRAIDSAAAATIKITLIEGTTHGKLIPKTTSVGKVYYMYQPEPGYLGNDKAIFMAEFQGKIYKVVVNLLVVMAVDDNASQCPQPQLIKVNKPASGSSGYNLNSTSVTFEALEGGALGQTTGTSITLDDNAANHNWFIDTTPGSNEEFLPTSNPYEWVAKAGSAAYGKMDMLSVLLHEYGHALGIDHSADGHDYMATTLTAGVRRMPSAEELALMQQLISGVKTEMASVSTQGSGNTPSQLPLLPLGGFGLAFLGRLRSNRYGSLNIEADLSTLVTQFAVTANEKLTNGNFSVASGMPVDNGWATLGSVDFTPSTGSGQSGSATLKEVSTSQTRLNQVFVVNPRDRFLSFTIAGSVETLPHPNPLPQVGEGANGTRGVTQNLDDVNGAPDDAFEVALLDANTGLSLAGAFSLTHTDAMLNLQADGTETAASSVTRVTANNLLPGQAADGSRTYRVDLSGIAVGTAVNLSFDLIGFGKSTSEITVRDVRVSGLPELHDDAATMNEDGSLPFDPFAQVDNPGLSSAEGAALLLLGSHVVDVPAHGTVTDGTFVYTPTAQAAHLPFKRCSIAACLSP